MQRETWSWRDYYRTFSGDSASPPIAPAAGETLPARLAPAPDLNRYQIVLPGSLHARLAPYAEKRGITLQQLIVDLLEIELDGELIDLTLDGDERGDAEPKKQCNKCGEIFPANVPMRRCQCGGLIVDAPLELPTPESQAA